ncbi:sodium-dependent nutrient amino acid transporter 1-like isoform X2 [Daphnia pulex]|uniref:sodium-dependent nutrient amino acid transporter 1-like isoform X2 n=2 Tax=Daphnia pulex TaxID=6669 RepID=UPI001EDE05E2|nr:sodium-dependent nutrient amino acid transporter 1-like isoform X2 [Daphnia pulex]
MATIYVIWKILKNMGKKDGSGIPNAAFVLDDDDISGKSPAALAVQQNKQPPAITAGSPDVFSSAEVSNDEGQQRDTWGNPVEFLMSCISLSVGLGNIWRFPFTAYENGGGAFLIPYLVVLLLIGKPLYFLEMILGQFSSYGSVKVWAVVPLAKGVGYGGALATWFVVTYYCCLMALTVFYFFSSFQSVLPWTVCDPAWATSTCYNSSAASNLTGIGNLTGRTSSAEEFFNYNVLQKIVNIDDGVGIPEWRLTLCLLFSWIIIALILMKGVASSGKAAYFTAIFPYVVLLTLLVRGVTLDGAVDGILFFITPQWDKILTPQVWYAAVTQCFFSLSVGFGPIIMNASYNGFRHRIYRDATIVSFMDTFTSLLAGVTIFSILGNLAHESGKSIETVVQGGTGLAFISYPEAISKFDVVPQLFAVLFFLMLFTLGVGSAVSLCGCIITIICDAFPNWKRWMVTLVICSAGFLLGLVYVTPGGQHVLDVVDFFGGGFIIFVIAVVEVTAICWIYGLKNFLRDTEFMLGIRLGIYWKFTWGFFIPLSLMGIFIYSLANFRTFVTDGYVYPASLTGSGWVLAALALIQVPIWAGIAIYKRKGSLLDRLKASVTPTENWGPQDPKIRSQWILFKQEDYSEHQSWAWWIPKCVKKIVKIDGHSFQSGRPSPSTAAIVDMDGQASMGNNNK